MTPSANHGQATIRPILAIAPAARGHQSKTNESSTIQYNRLADDSYHSITSLGIDDSRRHDAASVSADSLVGFRPFERFKRYFRVCSLCQLATAFLRFFVDLLFLLYSLVSSARN